MCPQLYSKSCGLRTTGLRLVIFVLSTFEGLGLRVGGSARGRRPDNEGLPSDVDISALSMLCRFSISISLLFPHPLLP